MDKKKDNFVKHIACTDCGSSDANALYESGNTYCHKCGSFHKGGEQKQTVQQKVATKELDFMSGEVKAIESRGLREDTCKKYHCWLSKGGTTIISNYLDETGKIVAQKIRGQDKSFRMVKKVDTLPLYGAWLYPKPKGTVVITEGEIDALTVDQVFMGQLSTVSLPTGAHSADKALRENIRWLEKFDTIVLAFDSDEPGLEAAKKCAPLFTPGKVRCARFDLKDPNEMLLEGKKAELKKAISDAKVYRPDGVIQIKDIKSKVLEAPIKGKPWPWQALTDATYGRRPHEIYGFGGGTGCGKSDLLLQVMSQTVEELDEKIGIISLEQNVEETAKRLAGKINKKFYHLPDVKFNTQELGDCLDRINHNVFLYNHFGCTEWSSIRDVIQYFAVGCGIQHIFLDNLTSVNSNEGSRLEELRTIMLGLVELAQRYDITIYYVSHLSTPQQPKKPHEEGGRVSSAQFYGSRDIARCSNYLFGMERNQVAEEESERHKSTLRLLKARYAGHKNGSAITLTYNVQTGLIEEGQHVLQDFVEIGGDF